MRSARARRKAPVRVQIVITGGTRLERALVACELSSAAESSSAVVDDNGPIHFDEEFEGVEIPYDEKLGAALNWAKVTVRIE